MDPITQQIGINIPKDWRNIIIGELVADPIVDETLQLISSNLNIIDMAVTDDSISACLHMFKKSAKERKIQTEILEFVLGQLREKHKITAKPTSRIFVSQPERSFLGLSNVRHYRTLEEVRNLIQQNIQPALPEKINIAAISIFFLHLLYNEQIAKQDQLKQIFAAKAGVQIIKELCWLNLQDDQCFVSQSVAEFYLAYKKQKVRYEVKKICVWLGNNIFHRKVTMTELLKACSLKIITEYGTFAANCASGRIKTTAVTENRLLHLMGQFIPQCADIPDIEPDIQLNIRQQRIWQQHPVKISEQSTKTQYELVKKLVEPLLIQKDKEKTRQALGSLRVWLDNAENAAAQPWVWILTGWGYWLVDKGGRRKGRLASSTIKRYLQFCRPVLASLGCQELPIEQTEQWIDVVESAVDAAGTNFQPAAVRSFVTYLIRNGFAPDLSIHDLDIPALTKNVDANFFTPTEIETVLVSLRSLQGELAEVARLSMCFGFACGMRRNEISGLKIGNIRLCKLPYVSLRRTSERKLKSTRASRNLPLDLFWPKEELQLLTVRCNRAPINRQSKLFPDAKVCSLAMELVTKLLKAVTANQPARFHHLRHSFANWCLWLLSFPRIEQAKIPSFMQHSWLDGDRAVFLRERLGLDINQLGRREFHGLASLMGHSAPEITFHSYIHINDLVQSISKISNGKDYSARKFRDHALDKEMLQILNKVTHDYVAKKDTKPKALYTLTDVGNALFFLSGSRHAKNTSTSNSSLIRQLNDLVTVQTNSQKVCQLLSNVMRKKIPFRVVPQFSKWLTKLEQNCWWEHWSRQQLEKLIETTDPGKDFLFICRSIDECNLLASWLQLLELGQETEWRLHLTDRCYSYTGLNDVQHQIRDEIAADWQMGKVKNLAGPRGAARGKNKIQTQPSQSELNKIKCFRCDVFVRWDDIGKGEKRRNQLLVGVLKAQLLWCSVQY
jgi:integrase